MVFLGLFYYAARNRPVSFYFLDCASVSPGLQTGLYHVITVFTPHNFVYNWSSVNCFILTRRKIWSDRGLPVLCFTTSFPEDTLSVTRRDTTRSHACLDESTQKKKTISANHVSLTWRDTMRSARNQFCKITHVPGCYQRASVDSSHGIVKNKNSDIVEVVAVRG